MSNDTSSRVTASQLPERPENQAVVDPNQAPWSAVTAVVVTFVGFIVAQIIGQLALSFYVSLQHWPTHQANNWLNNSVTAQFFYVLISEVLTLGILWLVWRAYRTKGVRRAMGLARRIHWSDLGAALTGVLAYYAAYIVILSVVMAAIHLNTTESQNVGFSDVHGSMNLVLTFVSLVLLPPIVEELMFRGFLFSGLRRAYGFVLGALFTSLLFAAPHLLEGSGGGLLWTAGLDTFILSLVLCYLREKTGALYAGIGVHMMKNAVAFITLYVAHVH